jgi:hypothetical protein
MDTSNILDALYLTTCFVQIVMRAADFNTSVYVQLSTIEDDKDYHDKLNKFQFLVNFFLMIISSLKVIRLMTIFRKIASLVQLIKNALMDIQAFMILLSLFILV